MPFAEAAALANDYVEGFARGPLLKLLRCPLRRPPLSLMTMLKVSRWCLAEATAVPSAEAAALASDHVEGFPRGSLLKLLRCLCGGRRLR